MLLLELPVSSLSGDKAYASIVSWRNDDMLLSVVLVSLKRGSDKMVLLPRRRSTGGTICACEAASVGCVWFVLSALSMIPLVKFSCSFSMTFLFFSLCFNLGCLWWCVIKDFREASCCFENLLFVFVEAVVASTVVFENPLFLVYGFAVSYTHLTLPTILLV